MVFPDLLYDHNQSPSAYRSWFCFPRAVRDWWLDVYGGRNKEAGDEVQEVQGIDEKNGLSCCDPTHPPVYRDRDISSNVFVRSHSLAVGLVIPGFASPVLFVIGGWMYREGRKEETGDEEEEGGGG